VTFGKDGKHEIVFRSEEALRAAQSSLSSGVKKRVVLNTEETAGSPYRVTEMQEGVAADDADQYEIADQLAKRKEVVIRNPR
jgi:hypothetical protein